MQPLARSFIVIIFVSLISISFLYYITFIQKENNNVKTGKINKVWKLKEKFNNLPKTCNSCFLRNYTDVIANDKICDTNATSKAIDLLMLIISAVDNVENRDAIRDTWASVTHNNTANIRHVFILGVSRKSPLSDNVLQENKQHHDIFQQHFIDSRRTLTLKTLAAFEWATRVCSNAKHILKIDDDMWLNSHVLLNAIKYTQLDRKIGGVCASQLVPHRNNLSKFYASFAEYPRAFYPPMCFGGAMVTIPGVAMAIVNISRDVPFFYLEDIYTALCLEALNYTVISIPGFNNRRIPLAPCIRESDQTINIHSILPHEMRSLWAHPCRKSIK